MLNILCAVSPSTLITSVFHNRFAANLCRRREEGRGEVVTKVITVYSLRTSLVVVVLVLIIMIIMITVGGELWLW